METIGMQPKPPAETPPQYTAEERDFIATLERWKGRKPTQQEINLAMVQARLVGEL
jgi:hypothetical protein